MRELLLESFYPGNRKFILILLFVPNFFFAQVITVVNTKKKLLSGVVIHTENHKFIGKTRKNGQILLPSADTVTVFIFSYPGYESERIGVEDIHAVDDTVVMKEINRNLDEIVIFGRNIQYLDDIVPETHIITYRDIMETDAKTTADALAMSGKIFVQKSQFGGGSPVLRGFEANRILLVVDGVRMNNAIYRNGHLHNAITIDNFALKRMEILFGAGTLAFGSDAIGGVIHFKTKDPVFNASNLDFKLRYSSAANEKTVFADINKGNKTLANLMIVSFSDYDDLKTGDNRLGAYPNFGKRMYYAGRIGDKDTIIKNPDYNKQVGTAYYQYGFLDKMKFKVNKNVELLANIQFTGTGDIPRYDFLTEYKGTTFKYADWHYSPQKRFFVSLNAGINGENNIFYDKAIVIGAVQKINEGRIYRKFDNPWKVSKTEDLRVYSVSGDFKKYIKGNKNYELIYGGDLQYNDLNSSAVRKNIVSGETDKNVLSRYPSALAYQLRTGSYLQFVVGEKDFPYQLNAGYRLEYNKTGVKYDKTPLIKWPEQYLKGIENTNISSAFSLGAKYSFFQNMGLSVALSTGFRNPNIDDMAKMRVKRGEISVPNPGLKPEKSYNFEVSLLKKPDYGRRDFNFRITGFYTILKNAIIRKDFHLPGGGSVYIDEGDTLKVVANQNAERALIHGFSFEAGYKYREIEFSSSLVYTKGIVRDNDNDEKRPASHIPPLFGKVQITYEKGKFKITALTLFNGAKPIDEYGGSVDNPDLATPDGTYAWQTYNIYVTYGFSSRFSVNFGVENILDLHYRPFSSGISAPGRNLIVSLKGKF